MCMPRDPEVFAQPVSPKSASTDRATSATATICGHSTPGTGSRSTRSSSGWSRSEASTGCGFRSMQPRLATQASPAASVQHHLVGRAPGRKAKLDGRDPVRPRARRPLLEERLRLRPVHEPLQRHRPASNPAQRPVRHRQVVADQVQLGVPGPGKEHLPGLDTLTERPAASTTILASATAVTPVRSK